MSAVLDALRRDLGVAVRSLNARPGFTLIAAATLAVGIGASTTMFSVIHGVLLRSLPYPDAERIVAIRTLDRLEGGATGPVSPVDFRDLRDNNRSFAGLAAFDSFAFALDRDQGAIRLKAARVSADFFNVMGVSAAIGRALLPADDLFGSDRVVVLSHRIWQGELGADVDVVGRRLILNGENHTVVGIMPVGFDYPEGADLWAPLSLSPEQLQPSERRTVYLHVLGRLRPGVALERAQTDISTIASRLEKDFPESNAGRSAVVIPLREYLVGHLRPAFIVLLGAVGLVLLIACGNVANLFLFRTTSRQRELAIRTALGAGRIRISRQLLAESTLLGLLGGGGGIAFSYFALQLVRALGPEGVPRLPEVRLDGAALGVTTCVALVAGILCGLASAWVASRAEAISLLQDRAPGTGSGEGKRIRRALVIAEIGLAQALLLGGGLLIRSFFELRAVDPGFDAARVLTAGFDLFSQRYSDRSARFRFYRESIERVASLPGVEAAALTTTLPLREVHLGYEFTIEGRPLRRNGPLPSAGYDCITPSYFSVMGIRLLQGRAFTETDDANAIPVAIVNDAMARRYWPQEDAIGKRIQIVADLVDGSAPWIRIVGVIEGARTLSLDAAVRPEMFLPYAQRPWRSGFLLTRTGSRASGLVAAVRSAIHAVDRNVALSDYRYLDDHLSASIARPRFRAFLLVIFAVLALLLATVGVYSVVAFGVGQRTREIGIRMALGARPSQIRTLVVGDGLRPALVGSISGLAVALLLMQLMSSLLFRVAPTDVATWVATAVLLVSTALLACLVPARRAVQVDPIVALRHE